MKETIVTGTSRGAWLIPIALLTLAGCGGAASGASAVPAANGPATSSPSASAPVRSKADQIAAYKAVCALFTQAEGQAVVGDAVQLAPSPAPFENLTAGAVPGIGDATACEYWTLPPDGQGLPPEAAQNLHGFPALFVAVDTRLVGWQVILTNNKKEALSGLGGEAYYVPSQLEGDKSGGYLVAHKGSKYLWISRASFAGDAPPDVKDREITLARSILPKI